MRRVNLYAVEIEHDRSRPAGYRIGASVLGERLGAALIGATVYEVPPGQSTFPYHYEYGAEEWLVVLEGRPTLRHPGGEEPLEPGDVVCFPEGPEGAHKVTNSTDATVRIILVSTKGRPAVAVYPDSDKVGVWTDGDRAELMVHRESRVDYWDGEA